VQGAGTLLEDLALVLCVAAVTTVVFRRLRQPMVLGYLLAGVIVGPHVPIPLFADMERVHVLSELGVILVMFSVGLEFSVRKLVRILPTAGVAGVVQVSAMVWIGHTAASALGWTGREAIFAGALVAISSTMIVARTLAEERVEKETSEIVLGILLVQDLAAVVLLALLTPLSAGRDLPAAELAATVGRLALFLVGFLVVGFLVIPRAVRAVARLGGDETLVVTGIGLSFAAALLAQAVGYSVALGAFLAGSLVAESGEGAKVEHLVRPIRDVFAAVFFISVGMLIDPVALLDHWAAALIVTAVVLVGQSVAGTVAAFLSTGDVRRSVRSGMTLAQIGEFSFIIVGVGVSTGAVRDFFYPVAIAAAVLTTFTTPRMVRASGDVALFVDRVLPRPLQAVVSLYGTWLDRLRSRTPGDTPWARVRRGVGLLVADVACLAGIVIGASVGIVPGSRALGQAGLSPRGSRFAVLAIAALLALPFLVGLVRVALSVGASLASAASPPEGSDRPPRRAIVVTLQLAVMVVAGAPLLALTQPFVPTIPALVLGVALGAALGVAFWRNAAHLRDDVRAGAQIVVAALARQAEHAVQDRVRRHEPLPGLGELTTVRLDASDAAVGRTLAEIHLRGSTGATVVAIHRQDAEVAVPTGHERLAAGDVLAIAGTDAAVESAREVLRMGAVPRQPEAPSG
jgi:CPA2 family monovalent cation:H+ antiporter-2